MDKWIDNFRGSSGQRAGRHDGSDRAVTVVWQTVGQSDSSRDGSVSPNRVLSAGLDVVGKVSVPDELARVAGVGQIAAAGIRQHVDLGRVEAFGFEAGTGRGA